MSAPGYLCFLKHRTPIMRKLKSSIIGGVSMAGFRPPRLTTFQTIILLFAAVILGGSLLLMLPVSSQDFSVTPFNQALFTATSAVCVTGLVVQDTATHWSIFGQAVIMVLI